MIRQRSLPRSGLLAVLTTSGCLVLSVCLLLSGCSGTPDPYPAKTAASLQSAVLTVTQSSASGDYAASMTSLDELTARLQDALARGALGRDRYNSINSAIALVRSDLESAIVVEQQQLEEQQQEQKHSDPPGKKKGKK